MATCKDSPENVTLCYLYKLSDEDNGLPLIKKLMEWGLLAQEGTKKCPRNHTMCIRASSTILDKYKWSCSAKRSKKNTRLCNYSCSIRKNTFTSRSHLTLFQIAAFVHMWINHLSQSYIENELCLSRTTCIDYSYCCGEIVYNYLINQSTKVGGEGTIVEIYGSKFSKRTSDEQDIITENWVFGGIQRGTGEFFFFTEEDKDIGTLDNLIESWILPGTTIMSECWTEYKNEAQKCYDHFLAKHFVKIVSPDLGMEKTLLLRKYKRPELLGSNLARYIFQKKCKAHQLTPTIEFFKCAGTFYNPLLPLEEERHERSQQETKEEQNSYEDFTTEDELPLEEERAESSLQEMKEEQNSYEDFTTEDELEAS